MKNILSLLLLLSAVISTSCDNSNKPKEDSAKNNDTASGPTANNSEQGNTGTIDQIVSGYLDLKNALANDSGVEAEKAANEISEAIAKLNESTLTPDQKKVYGELKDDIKEHAGHIGKSGSNIAHQREHFDLLSKDMIDLVKATGTSKALYKDFCPMYNNKKGASWLSEIKEIKNPYFGKEMSGCGEVKEEIKAKG